MFAASDLMDSALATAMHVIHADTHRLLEYMLPGALVLHQDMFLDISLIADITMMSQNQ